MSFVVQKGQRYYLPIIINIEPNYMYLNNLINIEYLWNPMIIKLKQLHNPTIVKLKQNISVLTQVIAKYITVG